MIVEINIKSYTWIRPFLKQFDEQSLELKTLTLVKIGIVITWSIRKFRVCLVRAVSFFPS